MRMNATQRSLSRKIFGHFYNFVNRNIFSIDEIYNFFVFVKPDDANFIVFCNELSVIPLNCDGDHLSVFSVDAETAIGKRFLKEQCCAVPIFVVIADKLRNDVFVR